MKIIKRNESKSNFTYFNFRNLFSICYVSRLFSNAISFEMTLIICAAYVKSKNVSNWQIEITYAFRVRWITYWFFEINFFLIMFFALMNEKFWFLIDEMFFTYDAYLMMIVSFFWSLIFMSLNLIEFVMLKHSRFLIMMLIVLIVSFFLMTKSVGTIQYSFSWRVTYV